MAWSPLPQFLHAKVVRAFLPHDRLELLPPVFHNVYPGDDVFVFETNGTKWGRAYVVRYPSPGDFSTTIIDLDKLPEPMVLQAVVPMLHLKVYEEIPISQGLQLQLEGTRNLTITPTLLDMENTALDKKKTKPPLPLLRLDTVQLPEELTDAIVMLNNHIYALYATGEFHLFHKLTLVYRELDECRIKLKYLLCSSTELPTVRRTAAYLLGKVAKLLGLRDMRKRHNNFSRSADTMGFEAIMLRDVNTGELFDRHLLPSPLEIALNQELYALAPNFPVSEAIIPTTNKVVNHRLIVLPPLHILVDFQDVEGEALMVPSGFGGMTAYLYLRSPKKRLTEAFAIHIDPLLLFLLENLSGALFKNIPAAEIDHGRIYLVAVLTEDIVVNRTLKVIKQGIAAGVTDILRIFSRHKGHLSAGDAHRFSIRMYGSHLEDSRRDDIEPNNGWGELVDRIIAGLNRGIAINPRVRRLHVSLKEFQGEFLDASDEYDFSNAVAGLSGEAVALTLISPIRSFYYDPLGQGYERLYLRTGKIVVPCTPEALVTLEVLTTNPHITFAKGLNQKPHHTWRFVLTRSGEVIGEIIKITGIEHAGESEAIKVVVYVNGDVYASGRFTIMQGRLVVTQPNGCTVTLRPGQSEAPASIELFSEYVGQQFNVDPAISRVIGWSLEPSLWEGNALNDTFMALRRIDIATTVVHFDRLMVSLLELLQEAHRRGGSDDESREVYPPVAAVCGAITHFINVVAARLDQYVYVFEHFLKTYPQGSLPLVGQHIFKWAGEVLANSNTKWDYVGRAICRLLVWICRLAIAASNELTKAAIAASIRLTLRGTQQLSRLEDELRAPDQIELSELLLALFEQIRPYFSGPELVLFVEMYNVLVGTRGLGTKNTIVLGSRKTSKVHQVQLARLEEMRASLDLWYMLDPVCWQRALTSTLYQLMGVLSFNTNVGDTSSTSTATGALDIDALRLALSGLSRALECVWTKVVVPDNRVDQHVCYGVARMLPLVAALFNAYYDYARNNGLFKGSRSFTQLFPVDKQFPDITIDSQVPAEVRVEVLLELATVFVYVVQITRYAVNDRGGYEVVLASDTNEMFEPLTPWMVGSEMTELEVYHVVRVLTRFEQGDFYPLHKWLSFAALLAETSVTLFELLKPIMMQNFVPTIENLEQFNRLIWGNYLKVILKVGHSMPVSICHLLEIPRKGCWKITGDVRERIAGVVDEAWYALGWETLEEDYARFLLRRVGGFQLEFIASDYGILKDLMYYALQRHTRSQQLAADVLWTLVVTEVLVQESLVLFEKECIVGLYDIYHSVSYKPSRYEQRNFIRFLKEMRIDPEDEAYGMVNHFINNLAEFLDILDQLNLVPLGQEFDDDRAAHKLNIKGILMNVDKPELLHLFINEMYENNLAKGNYVQAALSLKLLADTIDWLMDVILPPSIHPEFPEQLSFKRKEELYQRIADNYVLGNRHEKALEVYLEICEAHDTYTFDLKRLLEVHARLSTLYADLELLDRLTPLYFRIAFIGSGFPRLIRHKQYIYEGLPFEHITLMHQRLLNMYPGAQIISSDEEAKQVDTKGATGRFLHITTVEPSKDVHTNYYSLGHKRFAENRDLKVFTVKKRVPGSTSVLDFWSEETTFETERLFPALMNRSQIVQVQAVKISPLDNALRTFSDKIGDLRSTHEAVRIAIAEGSDANALFHELSRQCSGTIDLPVNGGVHQYKQFFVDEKYANDGAYAYQLELLRLGFRDLTAILSKLLVLHGRLVPVTLRASHNLLEKMFHKNFKDELEELRKAPERDTDLLVFMDRFTADRNSSDAGSDRMSLLRTTINSNGVSALGRAPAVLMLGSVMSGQGLHDERGAAKYNYRNTIRW